MRSAPSALAGQSGDSPVWLARQSAARASRARSTQGFMVSPSGFGSLLRLRCSPSLQHHLYSLAAGHGAGGSQGTLPGLFGVIRPRSIGQTPKDVVVGTRAAWAGPWAWRRRVGGNLRLPASGCPSSLPKRATQAHRSCLSWRPNLTAEQARKGAGGPEIQNRSEQNWAAALQGCDCHCQRGQEPNPREGVPMVASFTLEHRRQAWWGWLTMVRPWGPGQEMVR